VSPAATTFADVYTVPADTQTVVSSIAVANRSTDATFRIAVRPGGEAIEDKHYVAYNVSLVSGDSVFLAVGITADAGDVVTVYASTANVSFSVFGSEIS
jgi:hypothetical protein